MQAQALLALAVVTGALITAVYVVGRTTTAGARRLLRELAPDCCGAVSRWAPTPTLTGEYRGFPVTLSAPLAGRGRPFSITVHLKRAHDLRIRIVPETYAGSALVQPVLGPRLSPVPGELGALEGAHRCVSNDPDGAAALLGHEDRKGALERIHGTFATPSLGPRGISAVRDGYPTHDEDMHTILALLDDFVALAKGFETQGTSG